MKWEYNVFQIDRKKLETYLNQLGQEGWELVNVDYSILSGEAFGVVKRPVP